MSPVYTQRAYVEKGVSYYHNFLHKDGSGGFSFDCDKSGKVVLDNDTAKGNYENCINGNFDVVDKGIEECEWTRRHRAYIECQNCKEEVGLYNFTNTCKCGADYNMSGSLLAPREQWGEETGEHWTECY